MTMRRSLALLLLAAPVVAQEPPPPPTAARPPRPVVTPRPVPAPRPAQVPRAPWGVDDAEFRARWELDAADMAARVQESVAAHRDEWEREARRMAEDVRARVSVTAPMVWDVDVDVEHLAREAREAAWASMPRLATVPRPAWARGDQGDSLYRRARELLNSGEYRRAAATFRDLTTKTPSSAYAADAMYWQAFALYRIGGTEELRSALEALEQQKAKYPGARMQGESEALAVRIRGALAARGDASSAAQLRSAAADSMLRCDREEQSVRAEALNALAQSDPDGALPLLQKTLARKDACAATLRRSAVFLLGSKRAEGSEALLTQVARTDPSIEVRTSAIEWLARYPGEGSLGVLEELVRDTSTRVQGMALRALVMHPAPRARQVVRRVVENAETPERLRLQALSAFDRERTTAEDVAWMRALYARTENPRIRSRLVGTLANIGGAEVDQWLLGLARDPEVDSDTRRSALRRVGKTLPIADLARVYDAASERAVREGVIEVLRVRPEAEATDKLIDIVKRGTDPQLRRGAISALTSKKDPRTMRLLMEIIDK